MVPPRVHTAARRAVFRRRRLLVATAIAFLLATAATGAMATATAARQVSRTVVVAPGDTLWGLGERYAPPGTDLRLWVGRVADTNHLTGSVLLVGQTLRVPR